MHVPFGPGVSLQGPFFPETLAQGLKYVQTEMSVAVLLMLADWKQPKDLSTEGWLKTDCPTGPWNTMQQFKRMV